MRGEFLFLLCNLLWLHTICSSSKKQCVARVKLNERITRHLLALSRNRWKPVPYLFVNLMELTIQSSFNMPWNLKQILPWEGEKSPKQPIELSVGLALCWSFAPAGPHFMFRHCHEEFSSLSPFHIAGTSSGLGELRCRAGVKVRSGLPPKTSRSSMLLAFRTHQGPVPWGIVACWLHLKE